MRREGHFDRRRGSRVGNAIVNEESIAFIPTRRHSDPDGCCSCTPEESPQTILFESAYVPRVCWFLNWHCGRGLDWQRDSCTVNSDRFKFAVEQHSFPTVHYRLVAHGSIGRAVMTASRREFTQVLRNAGGCGLRRSLFHTSVPAGARQVLWPTDPTRFPTKCESAVSIGLQACQNPQYSGRKS